MNTASNETWRARRRLLLDTAVTSGVIMLVFCSLTNPPVTSTSWQLLLAPALALANKAYILYFSRTAQGQELIETIVEIPMFGLFAIIVCSAFWSTALLSLYWTISPAMKVLESDVVVFGSLMTLVTLVSLVLSYITGNFPNLGEPDTHCFLSSVLPLTYLRKRADESLRYNRDVNWVKAYVTGQKRTWGKLELAAHNLPYGVCDPHWRIYNATQSRWICLGSSSVSGLVVVDLKQGELLGIKTFCNPDPIASILKCRIDELDACVALNQIKNAASSPIPPVRQI